GSLVSCSTPAPCLVAASSTLYPPQFGPIDLSRAPTASTSEVESPAPMIVCFASGGQCTKSHWRRGRSSPSMISSASPLSTRKSSWSSSQWYMDIGSPGSIATRWIPSCENCGSPSNREYVPRPSQTPQTASRALSTNQPSPLATSPCSFDSRCASGATRKACHI